MPLPNHETPRSKIGWVASLLFWSCLLLSASLYGAVVLSPKVLTHLDLQNEHYANQVRLVSLERQTRYLTDVATALETDAEFVNELARVDFDAVRPGEERIAVDDTLSLQARPTKLSLPEPASARPWYASLLSVAAHHRQSRRTMLFAAAIIAIAAFTFLQDASFGRAA